MGGLATSFVTFMPVLFANQAGLLYLRTKNRWVHLLAHFGKILAIVAAAFLVLLSVFDVEESVFLFLFCFSCSRKNKQTKLTPLSLQLQPTPLELCRDLFRHFFVVGAL